MRCGRWVVAGGSGARGIDRGMRCTMSEEWVGRKACRGVGSDRSARRVGLGGPVWDGWGVGGRRYRSGRREASGTGWGGGREGKRLSESGHSQGSQGPNSTERPPKPIEQNRLRIALVPGTMGMGAGPGKRGLVKGRTHGGTAQDGDGVLGWDGPRWAPGGLAGVIVERISSRASARREMRGASTAGRPTPCEAGTQPVAGRLRSPACTLLSPPRMSGRGCRSRTPGVSLGRVPIGPVQCLFPGRVGRGLPSDPQVLWVGWRAIGRAFFGLAAPADLRAVEPCGGPQGPNRLHPPRSSDPRCHLAWLQARRHVAI